MASERPSHEAFVMALGAALQRWGIPAHRLEARLTEVALRIGLQAQFYSTPTSLTVGFGPLSRQDVRMVRVTPGAVDLSKLLDLDQIAEAVAGGRLPPGEGFDRVEQVDRRAPVHPAPVVVAAFGVVAAGASRLFGAGLNEVGAALAAGLLAGLLSVLVPRNPRATELFELIAAFSVTLGVAGLQAGGLRIEPFIVILSGLIVLVPGLNLTVAISELATKNLVSGAARLTYAGLTLLQIGFGVALGQQVAMHWLGSLAMPAAVPLPPWTEALAVVITGSALVVLFQAPWRLWLGILLAVVAAVGGARLASPALGPQLSASVGALAVALVGNVYARWRSRPAVVLIVPGTLMLVPGSLGFRSVSSLLAEDPGMGIETAFKMGIVAVAIVAGLLVANVILPPSRGATTIAL